MADSKLSGLTSQLKSDISDGDLFLMSDVSATQSKKFAVSEFLKYFGDDVGFLPYKTSTGMSSSSIYYDSVNDRVGIGTESPEATFTVRSQGTNNTRGVLVEHSDNTTAFSHAKLIGARSRGTAQSPTAVLANDSLSSFNARGYKTDAWSNTVGGVYIYAAENWNNSATGTYVTVRGVATGGTTVSEWAKFNQNGLTLANIQAESTDVDKFLVSNGGLVKYRTGAQLLSDIGGQATLVSGTNIKTINGSSVLGSGDLTISASVTSPLTLTAGTNTEDVLTLSGNGGSYTGELLAINDTTGTLRSKFRSDGNLVLGGDFNEFNGSNSTLLTLVPGGSQGSNALAISDGGSNYFIMRMQDIYASQSFKFSNLKGGSSNASIELADNGVRFGNYSARNGYLLPDGSIRCASLTDAAAVNNSIYYSTDQAKLCYKDASGTVNTLY